jgi:4-hydroxy-tetrahydrodipicolinate reductase
MKMKSIRIAQIGLGSLGRRLIQFIDDRPNMKLVAIVDKDPNLVGKNVGELCCMDSLSISVTDSLKRTITRSRPDAIILATVSELEKIVPQIEQLVSFGLPIVTTCEELTYPWQTSRELANHIDRVAKRSGVAVLATGVNPGFLMDIFPITVTAVCQNVDVIRVSRIQNASGRRISFRKKIGVGLGVEQFRQKAEMGAIGHKGLAESASMICSRMGWTLTRLESSLNPVIVENGEDADVTVRQGTISGVMQKARGFVDGNERISLFFKASIGEKFPEDSIEVIGQPSFKSVIKGGIPGDVATCAIVINAIAFLLQSEAGLRTMVDLPPVSFSSGKTLYKGAETRR